MTSFTLTPKNCNQTTIPDLLLAFGRHYLWRLWIEWNTTFVNEYRHVQDG